MSKPTNGRVRFALSGIAARSDLACAFEVMELWGHAHLPASWGLEIAQMPGLVVLSHMGLKKLQGDGPRIIGEFERVQTGSPFEANISFGGDEKRRLAFFTKVRSALTDHMVVELDLSTRVAALENGHIAGTVIGAVVHEMLGQPNHPPSR